MKITPKVPQSASAQAALPIPKEQPPVSGMVQFVKINPFRGAFMFNGYPGANGKPVRHPDSRTNKHQEVESPQWGIADFSEFIHSDDEALLKWVRESPFCEGSVLQRASGAPAVFREINVERDAQQDTDTTLANLQALNAIHALPKNQLLALALSIGCTDPAASDKVRLSACFKAAAADPAAMMVRIANINGDTRLLAALEWALQAGACSLRFDGTTRLYYHGDAVLASNRDRAIVAIKENPTLEKYLLGEFRAATASN